MREVEKYLPKGNGRCLDAGAGAGIYRELARAKGYEYFGIDIEPRGLDVEYGDVCDIPFEDNYFDVVICIDVIEEVSDDLKALKEIRRVLKLQGVLVLHTPSRLQTHILVDPEEPPRHIRKGYDPEEIKSLCLKAGFKNIELYPTFNVLECIAWELNYALSHGLPINIEKLLTFDQSKYVPLGLLTVIKLFNLDEE